MYPTDADSVVDRILADGLIQAVMKADHVDQHALRQLLKTVARDSAARCDAYRAAIKAGPRYLENCEAAG